MYSPYLGRFLNVDPVSGVGGGSQRTNGYSYVMNNPLTFVDPDGRDLHIAFDFRKSGLTPMAQAAVMQGVAQRYSSAGVKSVNTYNLGSGKGPSFWVRLKGLAGQFGLGKTRVLSQTYLNKSVTRNGLRVFGKNNAPHGGDPGSLVYTGSASDQEPAQTNLLVNVGSHETGHSLLPAYNMDGAVPNGAEPLKG